MLKFEITEFHSTFHPYDVEKCLAVFSDKPILYVDMDYETGKIIEKFYINHPTLIGAKTYCYVCDKVKSNDIFRAMWVLWNYNI